jgi:hypothetical protein
MKRPLAGALFAAGALSLSALGAAGAAQAETVQPGNVLPFVNSDGTQITIQCPHPNDGTLNSVAEINVGAQVGTSPTSFTPNLDISTIDAFATDANSTWTPEGYYNNPVTPGTITTLVNSADHVSSVEIKLYSSVTDAITKPAVIDDQTLFNGTGKSGSFHFVFNKNHVSYGTMIVKWSKAGVAQDGEELACSVPNNSGTEGAPNTGPQFG